MKWFKAKKPNSTRIIEICEDDASIDEYIILRELKPEEMWWRKEENKLGE